MTITQKKPKVETKSCSSSKLRNSKDKVQMHRRSRTGCYTCRLRRKKCDEGTPSCSACKNLGLKCDYKRPLWWSSNEQRRLQKENIKLIIKRRKLAEKSSSTGSQVMESRSETPLEISHSISTSLHLSNTHDRSRSTSIESQLSVLDFHAQRPRTNCYISEADTFSSYAHCTSVSPEYLPVYDEYHIDNDFCVPHLSTYSESTISDFNSFQPDTVSESMLPLHDEDIGWNCSFLEDSQDLWLENSPIEGLNDFSHGASSDCRDSLCAFDLSAGDRRLLGFFISDILPIAFPILEMNTQGSACTNHVISALQKNKCYLHCCLSIAAQHFKASNQIQDVQIDEDVIRHCNITISELCGALERDSEHDTTLEAMLGMIILQGCVGRIEDTLPDIPWHQHFQAATSLVQKLDLHQFVASKTHQDKSALSNMTITAWIDILGATMLGRAPIFAHTYRERHLSETNSSLGLQNLMGCEDHVLYLISEIACLEALKNDGMGEFELCHHVEQLGYQISLTENGDAGASACLYTFSELLQEQLSRNVTDAFRIAARIYLCSLVPGFKIIDDKIIALINKLTHLLAYIPSGPTGFDRSLVWVYLIAGSATTVESPFRTVLSERLLALGDQATFGCLGRVSCILQEIWNQIDDCVYENSPIGYISWRDVMRNFGWDYLLI
ncbi:Transcriptional regulatory protein pro1 [Erysiphe neolycopersici]|uniref:Transcriptional regulatory protein pro1 n=1 Tax=Erysiphe neolycopersici TaxID=212602 RepID=A0A420HKA8_9PEZI|nr:Transcriptional regulatory protein pro1 [Erysiphe neolycopersici]